MDNCLLKTYKDSFKKQANVVFKTLKDKGFSPTRDRYEDIIATLNIIYKGQFDELKNLEFSVTDGSDDGGVDAVVLTKDSLDIFEFKVKPKLSQKDLVNFNNRFERQFIVKPEPLITPESARLEEVLQKWWEKKKPSINIYFVRPYFLEMDDRQKREIERLENNAGVKVHWLDDKELLKRLREDDYLKSAPISKDGSLVLLKEPRTGEIKELILKTPLKHLLDLYSQHIRKDKNLFAQNIRIPKTSAGFRNSVEKSIRNNPGNFHLLHNGIVLVAKNINENGSCFHLTEPQVVNGAQTIGSIYKNFSNDLSSPSIKAASVICKILVTDDTEEIEKLCEATNTQRPVKTEDLRTNDLFQKNLEIFIKAASLNEFFYNRKGDEKPKNTISISYIKFYQWCYAALLEKPAEAKNARKILFINDSRGKYTEINSAIEQNTVELLRLCKTALKVNEYISKEKNIKNKSLMRSMDLHIVAALFKIKSTEKTDFKMCFNLFNKFYKATYKEDKSMTPNKVFTKSDDAWNAIKLKLSYD